MRNHFHVAFMLILLVLVGYLTYQIFAPFLVAIFLAFVLSQLFKSWYEKISHWMKNRKSLASLTTCLLIIAIIIIPLSLVSALVVSEIGQGLQNLQQTDWANYLQNLNNHPLLEKLGISQESLKYNEQLTTGLKNVGNLFFQALTKTYQSASHFLFMTLVMFFSLYYLFKDGDLILEKLMSISPLKNSQERLLLQRFIAISKATLKGSLVIAIVQGVLLGVLFWITGVNSPVFWGVITVVFAMIPMLGTAVVWLPASIILLVLGHFWQGSVIFICGALVISMIDNLLRPILVSNQASLHPLLVFLATLGGIAVFGLAGILLGPVIVVLFITLLSMYQTEFEKEIRRLDAS